MKLLNSRSDVILPHKKFTWADFFFFWGGGGINTDIHPRRYAPVVFGSFVYHTVSTTRDK